MYISFWNTLRWFFLLMWAVKAACAQRRVDTSQDFHWSQGPCVPGTAVRKSCSFPSEQDCCCSGNGEYSNPCPFFKSPVLCLCIHAEIVCDDDRDCFRAHSYICNPSNCCNNSSGRNFVGASAKKVFGEAKLLTWNLHHTSHLSPHQRLRKYHCCIIEVWIWRDKAMQVYFLLRQYWTSSISFIFLVDSG